MSKHKIIISIIVFLIISLLIILSLKQTAEKLNSESIKNLYSTKNRSEALKKARLSVTLWPLDDTHRNWLGNLEELENRSAIIIFLKENTRQEEIQQLEKEIESIKGVKEVKFISREEVLRIYKETNKEEPALLELVTANVLPASIEVYLDDFTLRDKIEQLAKGKPFVTEVIQGL